MKAQSKAAWILIITFIAGGALGALTHRAVMRGRIRGIIRMREAGLLVPWRGPVMDRLKADQKETVAKLFDEHGRRLTAIHERTRKEIDAEFEALWKELEAALPAEDIKKIKADISRFPPPPPGKGPGGMPPGQGPGGPPAGPDRRPGTPGLPGDPGQFGPGGPGGPGGHSGKEPPPPPPVKPPDKNDPGNGTWPPGVQ